jgi:hypothetical protein
MYAISKNWPCHPNAYKWPQEEVKPLQSNEQINNELQTQVAGLNKRLEQLTYMVQSLLSNTSRTGI